MRDDQQDRLIAAADAASIAVNGIPLFEGISEGHRIFAKLADELAKVRTREQVKAMLDRSPDLSFKDELLVRTVCKFAPHLVRVALKVIAQQATRNLPQAPAGGRPRMLDAKSERELCDFISKLIRDKVATEFCYFRASQRFGISVRQTQRIWGERNHKELSEDVFQPTYADALAAAGELLAAEEKDK